MTLLHTLGKIEPARVAIVGLGARDRYSLDRIHRASAIGCRTLRKAGAPRRAGAGLGRAWSESGAGGARLRRGRHPRSLPVPPLQGADCRIRRATEQGKANENTRQIESITVLGGDASRRYGHRSSAGASLPRRELCRDLGNEPPNVLTPTEFAKRSENMAESCGLECEVFGRETGCESWAWARCWASARAAARRQVHRPALSGWPGERAGPGVGGQGHDLR